MQFLSPRIRMSIPPPSHWKVELSGGILLQNLDPKQPALSTRNAATSWFRAMNGVLALERDVGWGGAWME